MAIKGKDFKKAVTFIKEFLVKLPEDEDCAELRDGFNLVLLHMKKYFKTVWLRTQERQSGVKLRSSVSISRGLSPLTPYQDIPDHFQWKWVDLDSQKGLSKSLPSDGIQTVPLILQAAKEGDETLITQLIEKDTNCKDDVDALGRTALMYAVHVNQNECVATLLKLHANINIQANDGSTVLHRAVYDNNYTALEILLQYKPDVTLQDCYGRAPIHWASMASSSANMELLLRANVNVSVRDRDGLTPAMWACRMDNTRHLELILNSPNNQVQESDGIERDMNGRTWIHWAVRRTEPMKCLKKLITPDTVAIRDSEGKTVLHMAAEQGSMEACRIILNMVGNECLKETDNICRTCLHLAVINGHGEVVNLLLEEGVNMEEQDKFDATAMDYATNKNLHYCLLILNSFSKHKTKEKPEKNQWQNNRKIETKTSVDDSGDIHKKPKSSNKIPEINNNSAIVSRTDSPTLGEKHPKPPGQPRPVGRKITPPPPRPSLGEPHIVGEGDDHQLDSSETPSAPPIEMDDEFNLHQNDEEENTHRRSDAGMGVDDREFHTSANEDEDAAFRKELSNGNPHSDSYNSDMSDRSIEVEMVVSDIEEEVVYDDAERSLEPMAGSQIVHARMTPAIQVQPPYPPSISPVRLLPSQNMNQPDVQSQQMSTSPHVVPSPPHVIPSASHQMPPAPHSISPLSHAMPSVTHSSLVSPHQVQPSNQMHMESTEVKPTPSPRTLISSGSPLPPPSAPLMPAKIQPLAQRQLLPLDGQPVVKPAKSGKKKKKKRSSSEGGLAIGPVKSSGIEPINGGLGGRVLSGISSPLQPSSPRLQPKMNQQKSGMSRPSSSQDNSPRSNISPRANTSWEVGWEPQARQTPPTPPFTPRESRDSSLRQTEMPNLISNSGRRSRSQSNEIETMQVSSQQTIDLNSKDVTGRRQDVQSAFNSKGRSLSSNALPRKSANRGIASGLPAPQPPGPRPLGI
ncbi:uncharacterized protein [Antedon mediterranea]|uniref:uncharacterized protein n=1 Tax=Antedon mediterranea TaxID=105859 RepID=UPI003AF9D50B